MLYVLYSIHAEKGNEILMIEGSGFRRRLHRKKGSQPRLAALGSPFPKEEG